MPSKLDDGPSVKRQKLHDAASETLPARKQASRIFAPFRTIGLVSPTPVPFTAIPLGKTTFQITTSVGRCLQTYDLRRGLQLVFITRPQTPGAITGSVAWADKVLAAWNTTGSTSTVQRGVWVFKRGKKIAELEIPEDLAEDIVELVVFGSWIVGCCSTEIVVWKSQSFEHYTTILPAFSNGSTNDTVLTGGICAIPTYTNKILAGRENGCVEVWNVSTGKLVYTIQPPTSDTGPVTAMQPPPALSLVAIAYYNGTLVIHDIHADRELIKLRAGVGDQLPVTTISFRTDGRGVGTDGRNAGMMATASYNSGDVVLWDLNTGGKKIATLRAAHHAPSSPPAALDGGVSKVEFLVNQAVLVTSGLDNALRSWIFDETPYSPIPRILHARSGHAAPLNTVDFLPAASDGSDSNGKWILTSSEDRSLWGWSIRRDNQSAELSQGSITKKAKKLGLGSQGFSNAGPSGPEDLKASPITCIACCLNRDGGIATLPGVRSMWQSAKQLRSKSTATEQNITGWESVVTGHTEDKFARTWFWGRGRAGRWILETGDGSAVSSVAISPCGTFALVGSETGGIDMYNLQSGMHRQRFPARLAKFQAAKLRERKAVAPLNGDVADNGAKRWSQGQGKHTKAVIGLHVDNLNRTIVSAGLDGKVKFWDFASGLLLHQMGWSSETTLTKMAYHRSNQLIALPCADLRIRVIDIEGRRVVRHLTGHKGSINDLCFSQDGRWMIAASQDSTIRVWDLPTGHLIDAIGLSSPCRALSLSSTGEFMAVALEKSIGLDLWTNRTLFASVPTKHISDDDIAFIEGPTASGEGGMNPIAAANDTLSNADDDDDLDITAPHHDQLGKDMMTLSLVPQSRWQTLINLDLIRERNKPQEAPKAPEKAPFFLPSLVQNKTPQPLDSGPSLPDSSIIEGISLPERSRLLTMDREANQSSFTMLLRSGAASGSYEEFVDHFKTLPPSAADIEIRSLSTMEPYTELTNFLDALTQRMKLKRDYEVVQAWMAVFLKCHGEVVQEAAAARTDDGQPAPLIRAIKEWREVQKQEAARLNQLLGYCAGVLGFLRSSR